MKGEHMNKPKLIGGVLLVFILGALAGVGGNHLYFKHCIKHRFERFENCGGPPFMLGHKMGRFGEGGHPPCMFEPRMEPFGKIINELDLTADQKNKVDDILTKNQDERKKLRDSLREARKQFIKTVVSAKEFDEAAFRKGFQQVSSIKENLAVLRAKMIPELKAVLTPEQVGYLRGRMEARKDFCMKNREGLRRGHHGGLAEPDMTTPQHHREQGEQPNS